MRCATCRHEFIVQETLDKSPPPKLEGDSSDHAVLASEGRLRNDIIKLNVHVNQINSKVGCIGAMLFFWLLCKAIVVFYHAVVLSQPY